MRVAILFTGALRTINKTIRYFQENALLNSDVHVFACVQNDTQTSEIHWNDWFKEKMGQHLRSLEWFNIRENQHWQQHRDFLLNNMAISDHWKHYLKNSGSMIEYYQMQLAYVKMMNYELTHNIQYDYIIRIRTDTIFSRPVDFHWLNWTQDEVDSRVETIKTQLIKCNIEVTDYNVVKYFMNTLISDDIISNVSNLFGDYIPNRDKPIKIQKLHDYLKNGSYILTYRVNLLYIVRRDMFYLIPSLGTFYGFQLSKSTEMAYRWNAESQFQAACSNSNLSIFDYRTEFDEKSLYEYDEKRYFDSNNNIINPLMVYCLVRS